jgi:hypothetical protein
MQTWFILLPIDVVRGINIEPVRRQHTLSLVVSYRILKDRPGRHHAARVDSEGGEGPVSFW